MYLICDIGNTETKICIFDSKKKLKKKINLKTKLITKKLLNNKLSFSVIPKKKIQKARQNKQTGSKTYLQHFTNSIKMQN